VHRPAITLTLIELLRAPPWLLTAGFAYDSSPVSDTNRTVAFAVDRQFRYAGGVQYDISPTLTVGAALTIIDAGNAPINQAGGPERGTMWATTRPTSSMRSG
jgi:long-chain fatty acid transport protein